MPTGYTAAVQDGADFQQFVWICARQFGAFILERDTPLGKTPKMHFEVENYYFEAVEKADKELAEFIALTAEGLKQLYNIEMDAVSEQRKTEAENREKTKLAYELVLDKAIKWEAPSSEHRGLKDFMIQQLTESIKFDCSDMGEYYKVVPYEEWSSEKKKSLKWKENYTKEDLEKQKTIVAGRNKWIADLIASVPYKGKKMTRPNQTHKLTVCFLVLTAILTGCDKHPLSTSQTGNSEIQVDKLFEHDGCSVYRFEDAGHNVYYTDCTSTAWSQNCGKNCQRPVEVKGTR